MTPKRPLHDFFANHRDTPVKSSPGKVMQFSRSGFNCNCESLVVESSFIGFSFPAAPLPPVHYIRISSDRFSQLVRQTPPRYFELRGPPSL